MTKEFDSETLRNLVWRNLVWKDLDEDEDYEVIVDEIISTTRWAIVHKLIFKHDGKFWQTTYNVGATEMQDEIPFDYTEVVKCSQVVPKEIATIKYVLATDE